MIQARTLRYMTGSSPGCVSLVTPAVNHFRENLGPLSFMSLTLTVTNSNDSSELFHVILVTPSHLPDAQSSVAFRISSTEARDSRSSAEVSPRAPLVLFKLNCEIYG